MSESKKNFNLNNMNDCVDLLSILLEKSNAKGMYTLEESAWAYTCLNNLKNMIKTSTETPRPSLLPPNGFNNQTVNV